MSAGALVEMTPARQAIAQAETIPELKLLRDQAATIQRLVRDQCLGLERQNEAAELKLRCERRLGEMLAATVVPRGRCLRDETTGEVRGAARSLPDGVTSIQSHRWRREWSVPEHVFEAWMAETRERGGELTTAGLLELAEPASPEHEDEADDDFDAGNSGTDADGDELDDGPSDSPSGYSRQLVLSFEVNDHGWVVQQLRRWQMRLGTSNPSSTVLSLLKAQVLEE